MKIRCLGCMHEYDDELGLCPECGYEMGTPAESALHMQPSTILAGRYLVGRVIGFGGFGVTYIGWDNTLQQRVAIKEYLPSEFATRAVGQTQVTVFGGNKAEQFAGGMDKFVEEAKNLAKFQNEPGIVRVYDSFKDNNTAYIVMEYLDGETLTSYLEREGKLDPDQAARMLAPVIQSLETIHGSGIIHRDIAPDNIMITKDGEMKLIDFGAARYATTSHSRSLTVIIKPGYSPEEQYRSRGDQGPHTDVYAVGAVLYRMVTGETPPDALERRAYFENKKKDMLLPPSKFCKISKGLENAILNAMNVRIEDRTPTAAAFLAELTAAEVKRKEDKIKGNDLIRWPIWLKILMPTVAAGVVALFVLFFTGVIQIPGINLNRGAELGENETRVPSIINYATGMAQSRLEEAYLVYELGGNRESAIIPAGVVLEQDVTAASVVNKASVVRVIVSSGVTEEGTVPFVAGDSGSTATTKLEEAGATVRVEREYDQTVPEGQAIRTDPAAGEPLEEGMTVILYVSKGRDPAWDQENAAVYLNMTNTTLYVGDTIRLTAQGGDGTYQWTSDKPGIATVDGNGQVVAVDRGTATITVTSGDGTTATCVVTVRDYSFTANPRNLNLTVGGSGGVAISGVPDSASVRWSSSSNNVTVNGNGDRATVTARSEGQATVTATIDISGRTYYAQCDVSVTAQAATPTPTPPPTPTPTPTATPAASTPTPTPTPTPPPSPELRSVRLSQSSLTLNVGDGERLSATVDGSNLTNSATLVWASGDSQVATVDQNGNVKAVGAGSTTILVTASYPGCSAVNASCTVKVNAPVDPSFDIDGNSYTMKVGEILNFTNKYGAEPSDAQVHWESSDPSIADFYSSGRLTAEQAGTITVTGWIEYNGRRYEDTCTVTVLADVSITLSDHYVTLNTGEGWNLYTTISGTSNNPMVVWEVVVGNLGSVEIQKRADGSALITFSDPGSYEIRVTITVNGQKFTDECDFDIY